MDQNWSYGGPVRSGGYGNSWQGPPRHRGRGGSNWYRPRNPNDNYFPSRQGAWTHRPHPYYRNQNPYHHRGGGYRARGQSQFDSTPYAHSSHPTGKDNIDSWISPRMWEDPWADLMQQFAPQKETEEDGLSISSNASLFHEENTIIERHATSNADSLDDTLPEVQTTDEAKQEEASGEESKVQNNSPTMEEPEDSIARSPPAKRPHTVIYDQL